MSNKSKFVKGGIIGAIVGLVGGLLFAPKSGKETRADIKDAANRAAREAEKKLKELHGEMITKKDEAAKFAEMAKGKARDELAELSKRADIARVKLGELITAVRDGELDEAEYKKASKNAADLAKEIKSKISAKKK